MSPYKLAERLPVRSQARITRPRPPPLLKFLALTFVWSWTFWGLGAAARVQLPGLSMGLMFAGSFGPSMAAVAVVANSSGRAGLRSWAARCLNWRIGWGWWAFAVLFPLVVMLGAAGLHLALGGKLPDSPATGHLLLAVVNFFAVLLLGGPLGEELGWRGYALPTMQKRMGWRLSSLWLGLVWGAWHLPLFFIDGTSQALIPLWLFLLSVVGMSVLFAWVVHHTHGSVLVVLVLHTSVNFWPSVVPVLPNATGYQPYAIVVVLLTVTALVLLIVPGRRQ